MNHFFEHIEQIETKIGYRFANKQLLLLAFTHRSFINENRTVTEHNERLEFLGDSVLGLMSSDYLYRTLVKVPEGELSSLRAKLVESSSCIAYIEKLDLGKYLLLGKGEKTNDGRGRDSILSDLFEAIIGAIYLDSGLEAAQQFFLGQFHSEIEAIVKTPQKNSKALLQDYCQKKFQRPPTYKVIEESGPEHSKTFCVAVSIQSTPLAQGKGASKKQAQQAAAAQALNYLKINGEGL